MTWFVKQGCLSSNLFLLSSTGTLALALCACSGPTAPTPAPEPAPTTTPELVAAQPTAPPPLSIPTGPVLVAGNDHTCASAADGGLECWGAGESGQLGDGHQSDRSAPVRVLYVRDVALAAAGAHHTCAQTARGQLYCWGKGFGGWLGEDQDHPLTPLPVRVPYGPFTRLAAGNHFTCGLSAAREPTCFGLRYGDSAWQFAPEELRGADDITATDLQLCARLDGQSRCFEFDGPELDPARAPASLKPLTRPDDIRPSGAIARGLAHACARTDAGIRCWGDDSRGQLASGRALPVPGTWTEMTDLDAVSLAATSEFICAVRRTGEVVCWGHEPTAEDAIERRFSYRLRPMPSFAPARAIAGQHDWAQVCTILRDGGAQCSTTDNDAGSIEERLATVEPLNGVTDAVAIGITDFERCVLDGKGRVSCNSGGDDQVERVTGIPAISALHVSGSQACGRDRRGRLWCWGDSHDSPEQPKFARRRCRGGPRHLEQHDGPIAEACRQDAEAPLRGVRGFLPTGGAERMALFWAFAGKSGLHGYFDTDDGGSIAIRKGSGGLGGRQMYKYVEEFPMPADTARLVGDVNIGCAVTRKRATHCWGELFGPLPIAVNLPGVPMDLVASSYHACMRSAKNRVYCQRIPRN